MHADRLAVLLVVVLALWSTAAAGAAGQAADTPTVSATDATGVVGETVTVAVRVDRLPDGLAGYNLTLRLVSPAVAEVRAASYPDHLGLTEEPRVGADGRSVRLRAADIENETRPGATDVVLARVELAVVGPGETEVRIEVHEADDDHGTPLELTSEPGAVAAADPNGDTDTPSSPADGDGSQTTPTDAGAVDVDDVDDVTTPGFGVPVALVALAGALLVLRRR